MNETKIDFDPEIQELENKAKSLRIKLALLKEINSMEKEIESLKSAPKESLKEYHIIDFKDPKEKDDWLNSKVERDLSTHQYWEDVNSKADKTLGNLFQAHDKLVKKDFLKIESKGQASETLEEDETNQIFKKKLNPDLNRAWYIPGNKVCVWSQIKLPTTGDIVKLKDRFGENKTRIINKVFSPATKVSPDGITYYTCLATTTTK